MAFMDFLPQFKENTQDVSGVPANDELAQLQLKRKLQIADALRQGQMPEGQMISGHYVAPSITQYMANAMNKYYGGKAEEAAMKRYGEYQKTKSAQLGEVLQSLKPHEEDFPLDTVQSGGAPGMWETKTVNPNMEKTIALLNKYDPSAGARIAEGKISKYLNPESNLGKVEIDKFTPQSIATYQKTGDYNSLVPVTKAESNIFGKIDPKDYTATSVNKFLQTKNYADLIANPKLNENKAPAGYVWGKTDANGNPTLVPLSGGPADKSQILKPVPAQVVTGFVENQNALNKIDNAIKIIQSTPDSSFGLKNISGDTIMQRFDPKGVNARSAIAGIAGQKYHDISGAAVSAGEANRLKPYIPSAQDTKENILQKLYNMKAEYGNTNELMQNQFGEQQGYKGLQSNNIPINSSSPSTQNGWLIEKVK